METAGALTWQEIQERYPHEWVLVDEPELTDLMEVTRGRVVFHSADEAETDRESVARRLKSSALLFTGEPDPDLIYIL